MLLPGIGAILADSELVFLAISSDRLIIFETLTPGAGSNSYRLTTGPLLIALIFPSIPKSNKIFSIKSPSGRFLFKSELFDLDKFLSKYSKAGNLYLDFIESLCC